MNFLSFNLDRVEWRRIADSSNAGYKIDFEYSLLGFDLDAGRLDMLLRYAAGRGHCRRHRHVASTMTLVLEGEQCLQETQADGSTRSISRNKGDYALSPADSRPHLEHGGENGGTVLLSMCTNDGILFEYFGDESEEPWTVSIDEFVSSWKCGEIYGLVK
tara:strand:- start:5267 stop:5746 length:480 start_codon:yes stop_codon:yes gene_type:complete